MLNGPRGAERADLLLHARHRHRPRPKLPSRLAVPVGLRRHRAMDRRRGVRRSHRLGRALWSRREPHFQGSAYVNLAEDDRPEKVRASFARITGAYDGSRRSTTRQTSSGSTRTSTRRRVRPPHLAAGPTPRGRSGPRDTSGRGRLIASDRRPQTSKSGSAVLHRAPVSPPADGATPPARRCGDPAPSQASEQHGVRTGSPPTTRRGRPGSMPPTW